MTVQTETRPTLSPPRKISPIPHKSHAPGGERRRLEYLDAIRGLAALSVVLNHYVYSYGGQSSIIRFFPIGVWWDGMAGVSMFFVLSGFVLSLGHFDGSGTPGERELNYPRFFVARVFRIWVPYLAAVLFCMAIYHLRAWQLPTTPHAGAWPMRQWAGPLQIHTVLRDALLLRFERHPLLINPSWTLSLELIISLPVPAGIYIAQRSSGWLVFVALVLFQCLHVHVFVLHFAAGILLAKHLAPLSSQKRWLLPVVLLASWPLYNIRFIRLDTAWETNAAWIISGIGAAGILWVVLHSARLQAVLSSAILAHLGRVSYGLYLLHAPVLLCLTPRVLYHLHIGWYGGWIAGLLATIAISLLLAEIFYRWIEVPSIAAGKKLGRIISRFSAPSPPRRRQPLDYILAN